MTEPTPPAPAPPAPAPPAPSPSPPAPAPPADPGNGGGDTLAEIRATLDRERRERRQLQTQYDRLVASSQSDTEKALAAAKAEGAAEARKALGADLARARFAALAAGKLSDPAALADVVDLRPVIGDDGTVDEAALTKLVDTLAKTAPAPTSPVRVTAGPQGPSGSGPDGDFLGDILRKG